MKEIDFDPRTMTRATFADVQRIHEQLWGLGALNQYMMIAPRENGEVLDLTQDKIGGEMTALEELIENAIDNKVTPLRVIKQAEVEIAALRAQLAEAREVVKPFAECDNVPFTWSKEFEAAAAWYKNQTPPV